MKKIKMKDVILEHYQKVHELEMDGITVRVWKPRTTQQLPAYMMMATIQGYITEAKDWFAWNHNKADWFYGNPDWGMWDALLVRYMDARRKTLDIYVAAILIRPFSREAYEWYERHHIGLSQTDRLILMWDSREYDRIHGFDTSYGRPGNMDEWEGVLYKAENKNRDIEDLSPDYYHDDPEQHGLTLKFRHKDGQFQNETSWPATEPMPESLQRLLRVGCDNFFMVSKTHPEVVEMHYYTETTEWDEGPEVEENEES